MQPLDFIKVAYDVLKTAGRLDLAEQLTRVREDLLNLKEENLKLREKNENMSEQLKIKSKVVYERGLCWIGEDDLTNDRSKTPICPQCWQVDGIVNRSPIVQFHEGSGIHCFRCDKVFRMK